MTVEQELDGIDIDEIGNVEDLPKLCSSMKNMVIFI